MADSKSPIALDRLRARARMLMWLVTIPLLCLGLIALLQIGLWWRLGFHRAAVMFGLYLPMYVYLAAIWMVRRALKSIAQGDMFDRVVPRLLLRVGLALLLGALFQVFGSFFIGVMFVPGRPPINPLDGAAVTLGVVGATLALLSQLLARAAAMRAELDEFF